MKKNSKASFTYNHLSIVTITSDKVLGEWWGKEVLDINELHEKELKFDVEISHLKLRELHTEVIIGE